MRWRCCCASALPCPDREEQNRAGDGDEDQAQDKAFPGNARRFGSWRRRAERWLVALWRRQRFRALWRHGDTNRFAAMPGPGIDDHVISARLRARERPVAFLVGLPGRDFRLVRIE